MLAAIVDYGLLPKNLTPGWEEPLPVRSVAGGFGGLALGLARWEIHVAAAIEPEMNRIVCELPRILSIACRPLDTGLDLMDRNLADRTGDDQVEGGGQGRAPGAEKTAHHHGGKARRTRQIGRHSAA